MSRYKTRATPQYKKDQNERVKEWRRLNPEKAKAIDLRHRKKNKRLVLEHYGTSCACCGESDSRFLTIDHKEGNGNKHRRELGAWGHTFYKWLRLSKYPEGYQTLCWNCNLGKEKNGGVCPHKDPV